MANASELPEGIDETYENTGVRSALRNLLSTPDYAHLAAFLTSLREGYLVIDVTGAVSKKKGPRVRTIRSTKGQLVLPIFTSMAELRALAPNGRAEDVKGAIMPALSALSIITSDRFVAVELDKASSAQVILRKYISLVLGEEEITAELLEQMQ